MKSNYIVLNGSLDPYYNLALEEYLLLNKAEGTIVMLWQNDNTIVVGRNQNTYEEINLEYVTANHIHVVRRITGGGAVYHDLGNLNYSFIADYEENEDNGIQKFAKPVIETLKSFGVEAEFSGRNDILVEGKKVSGTAQHRYKNRMLNHGCLLYSSDLSKVAGSLKVSKEKFQSKAVKSVRSRVANICDFMKKFVPVSEFREHIIESFLESGEFQLLELDEKELEEVRRFRKEKYMTWEWNYGHPILCTVHNRGKYAGGILDIYLDVAEGKIRTCQLRGDFLSVLPVREVEEKLVGCRYCYEDVYAVLNNIPLREYLGTISAKEAAECLFCL